MNWKWWTLLNIGLISLGVGQYYFKFLEEVISRDQTYMAMGMLLLAIVTSVSTLGKHWNHWHEFMTDLMPRLGLVGTVVGFMISLDASAVAEQLETVEDVKHMIVIVLSGMSVALTTTLAGLVLQIWLDFQKRSIRKET